MSEERTIQIWPSGQSVTYCGNVWDTEGFRVRSTGCCPEDSQDGAWIVPTDKLRTSIGRELAAENILRHEIYCCDSSLVGALLQEDRTDGFSWGDDVRNLYPDPSEWTVEQCREWLRERGITWHDGDGNGQLEDLQDAVRDNAEPAEVMEWWRVSEWLCAKLDNIGEVTIDNGYGCWWGRTCTGQAVIMDGTLQRVAQELEQ